MLFLGIFMAWSNFCVKIEFWRINIYTNWHISQVGWFHSNKLNSHPTQTKWSLQVAKTSKAMKTAGRPYFCLPSVGESFCEETRTPHNLIELKHALGDIHWCLIAVIERLGISLNIEVKSVGNRFITIDQDRCLPLDRVWFGWVRDLQTYISYHGSELAPSTYWRGWVGRPSGIINHLPRG